MRRGEFDTYPLLFAGLEAWRIYNERILRFCGTNAENRILASVEGVLDRSEDFIGLLKDRLGVDLNFSEDSLQQIYRAEELNRAQPPRAAASVLAAICPAELALYDELNAHADLPESRPDTIEAGGSPLAAMEDFVGSLSRPIMPASRQGLLQVLLALMDPCASDARMDRMRKTAQDQQSRIDQLWQYAQQLQRVNSDLRTSLEQGAGRVAALEQQSNRQQHLIHQQQRVIDDQSAELNKLWPQRIRDAAHSAWQNLRRA